MDSPLAPRQFKCLRLHVGMEGERAWSFAAPSFAHSVAAAEPLASATYFPAGWKKRRKRGRKQNGRKRHRAGGSGVREAVVPVPPGPPSLARLAPVSPPDPTQLAALRCSLAHPAVLNLLAQQCWPAAGPAAAVSRSLVAAVGGQSSAWWNRMLPSLSLLYPPMSPQQQAAAAAPGGAINDASPLRTLPLPQHTVLVGYEVSSRLLLGSWLVGKQ